MLGIMGEYRAVGGAGSWLAFWLLSAALGYFLVLAVRLAGIDIREHRLPNRLVLPAYPAAFVLLSAAALAAGEPTRISSMLMAGAGLWGGYFLLRLISPAGMGFGDVKLAGVLGLYLGFAGWSHAVAGTVAAFVLGGLWGLGLILSRRGTARTAIPFGPFMLAGACLALLLPALQ